MRDHLTKNSSRIYFLLTSIVMILPPLVYGLSFIYYSYRVQNMYVIGFLMNYLFILLIGIIGLFLWMYNRLNKPTLQDIKLLLFGLIANFIIFLFVFQDSLRITDLIDIYISTILVLVFYFVLVNHKSLNYELTILSFLFFLFYRFHLFFVYTRFNEMPVINGTPILITILYVLIPLAAFGFYGYKIYTYKVFDWFAGVFTGLSVLSLMVFLDLNEDWMKVLFTIYLIMPFVLIIDLVVTKFKNPNKLPFYLRMTTIVIMMVIFKPYFELTNYQHEEMYQFTFIMYASIFINIIEHFKLSQRVTQQTKIVKFNLITDGLVKVGDLFELNHLTWKVVDVIEENMVLRRVDLLEEVIVVWATDYHNGYFRINQTNYLLKRKEN